MDRWAVAALVILLASAYSQYSAHERLVGALSTRIALLEKQADDARAQDADERVLGRPKVGLGIYIYSCHAGELFGFVPVARDEQAFSC